MIDTKKCNEHIWEHSILWIRSFWIRNLNSCVLEFEPPQNLSGTHADGETVLKKSNPIQDITKHVYILK